ncbi:hypothetical protein [Guptibacillus hwajinpoensis]|uniref:Uncharacterized protein n=1 Tax=Guptibacillus hwajinpoensis TaxID=208199 RepID=A0A0J6FXY1_9BACL|nr:hypothetical protein [Alkalihalobacillus macyae]KMM39197.1 hypothetical protein AB986_08215 [Alkalihalobacillus macyae]
MEEGNWDLQEVKRLKKKLLIQNNLGMLLVFALLWFFVEVTAVSTTIILGVLCAILWLLVANMLFTLLTGKVIGTRAMQRVQTFEIERHGKKQWKIKASIGLLIILAITIGLTVMVVVSDIGSVPLNFPNDSFAFIGAWLGMNLGQIHRIRKLGREISRESSEKQERGSSESV